METSQLVYILNQGTGLCMIRLLLKGISGEISGFDKKMLICLSESTYFFWVFFR